MSYTDLTNSINHPEFKRGWRVLAAAAIGTACGASQIPLNILGAIIPDLQSEFGWGRGEIQLGFLYFTLAGALTFPIGGYLMDRFGARPVALVATFLFGLSFAAIALSPPTIGAYYALWALCGVLGSGSTLYRGHAPSMAGL
jgi:OFA family oxalate/formate antiporter-like MFS transporter